MSLCYFYPLHFLCYNSTMNTKKTKESLKNFSPIIAGSCIMIVSLIMYFAMKAGFSSSCAGNAGCIVILPLFIVPVLSFIYGLALIPAFFKKNNSREKYKNKSIYVIAFKITAIIGLIIAIIPLFLFLLRSFILQ